MTVIFYSSKELADSTNSVNWVEHAYKQGILNARKHWVWIYAEYGGILTNRKVYIRVMINGVEAAGPDYHEPSESGMYKSFSTFIEVEPEVDDTPCTVSLEYRVEHASQTAMVRRVRLMVMQE